MMIAPMDKVSAPSSRELAERLYKKNIELESGLRKFAKSRAPSDPNIWFQIRENYEAIILEDHGFSEKHNIELALWQLHYRRIEEFRALLNAAKSAGSVTTQGGKAPPRPDSIKKIRSGFKTFLSESTGFYHDLILKIRSKFGLPVGFFSDGPVSQITISKDEKKSAVMKKGLMSCHRSLIYLGDLARYKGLCGEGDSVTREYAAASCYYKQAAGLCPSSGNPHHQLAILASYAGDDLLSIYRYFRSLAADIPFSTARDNLIIAFEKNRQSFSQLPVNPKALAVKRTALQTAGRGRGRGDASRLLSKNSKPEATPVKEHDLSISEVLKAFTTRFVRVNGILFTRTSLETFGEILSAVKSDLLDLMSSGPEEELNFGQDATENARFIVRLIATLIFTVHNAIRESDGQSYAEILQRTVLLQNAFTAVFEFSGHIIKRCVQLDDTASSFLLPAILVFIEWLACHPAIAAGSDIEEKQAAARSFFWNQCVAFMNKLVSNGLIAGAANEDETCFFDMTQYDEGETGNRTALLEDFELRGFLPLVPAQLILDFSSKHSYGSVGSEKEKQARVQRILAAGKALMNVVRIDQKAIFFDPCLRRFVIGIEPPVLDDYMSSELSDASKVEATKQASPVENVLKYGMTKPKTQLDGEDEDEEEIVFKPTVGEKYPGVIVSTSMSTTYGTIQPEQISAGEWATTSMPTAYETIQPTQTSSKGEWENYGTQLPSPVSNLQMPTGLHTSSPFDAAAVNFSQQPLPHMNLNTSKWLMEQAALLSNGLKKFKINENGHVANHGSQEGLISLQAPAFAFSPLNSAIDPISSRSCEQSKAAEAFIPSTLHSLMPSGMTFDTASMNHPGISQTTSKKTPVSRPVRHLGPPPGFSNTPKPLDDSNSETAINGQNPYVDDYSWLDGYHSPTKASEMERSVNHVTHMYQHPTAKLNGVTSFPFPGKQVSTMQTQVVNDTWQDFPLYDHLKPTSEWQLQQASFKPSMMPEQHQAHSLWSGYFV
ncbi:uncharacterized protein A4U43_C01F1260 [Asparagus officinalis]|uniref:DNA/RNA-binding domain-containing protein n=1 Tax=Asparagus officinalis TaxID=4686 RepID=A0A5P1FLC7_ASPOF|nr:protein SMG7-like [Asparagus officinalis]XP_020270649.1 protein SMG7-like [Asparagus officinalis]ONK78942.1 uncharacterized protein A4U43_C01F1260 [Asparagus officinalis]